MIPITDDNNTTDDVSSNISPPATENSTNVSPIIVPEPPFSDQYDKKLEILKLKMNMIKWVLGTFIITFLTFITTWNFNDREKGMSELDQYSKYTTDLMILNPSPIKKRMLAQFFAKASPSPWLRWCWGTYYEEIDKECKIYNKQKDSVNNLVNKLLLKAKGDSSVLSTANKISFKNALASQKQMNIDEKMDVILPVSNSTSPATIISTANDLENRGFNSLLVKDKQNAIVNFSNCNAIYPQYHNAYDISNYLKSLNDPIDWKKTYQYILDNYNWKMSEDIKAKLTELTK